MSTIRFLSGPFTVPASSGPNTSSKEEKVQLLKSVIQDTMVQRGIREIAVHPKIGSCIVQAAMAPVPTPRSTSLGRVSLSERVVLLSVRLRNPERKVFITPPGAAARGSLFPSAPSRSFSGSSMEVDPRFSSSEMSFVGGVVEMRNRDV